MRHAAPSHPSMGMGHLAHNRGAQGAVERRGSVDVRAPRPRVVAMSGAREANRQSGTPARGATAARISSSVSGNAREHLWSSTSMS